MIIAIPSVLNTLETSRRKTFWEYVNKVYSAAQTQWTKDTTLRTDFYKGEGMYIYDIKKDLGFSSTGSFGGYVVVNNYVFTDWQGNKIGSINTEFDITLYNDSYITVINPTLEGLPSDAIVQDVGDSSKYTTPHQLHPINQVGNSYIIDIATLGGSYGSSNAYDLMTKKIYACMINKNHLGISHMTGDSERDVYSFNIYDSNDTSTPLETMRAHSNGSQEECFV